MMARAVFSDLNVQKTGSATDDLRLLQALVDSGYERVALCHHVTLKKGFQLKPAPDLPDQLRNLHSKKRKRLEVLQRLTVTVEDPALLHTLSSPAADSYDLLALCPASSKVFQQACSGLPVDIVTFNFSEKAPFLFKHTQFSQAVERGLHLEIVYSPILRGSSGRKNTISAAQELVKGCKGKGVLVSSGAEKCLEVRPPPDVVNLSRLFELTDSQCKAAITTACRAALLHSRMRRHSARAVVSCHPLPAAQKGKRKATEREEEEPPTKILREK